MMKPQRPQRASDTRYPKLVSKPVQYVDVNDLRALLKLALGLHIKGDPIKRLNRAINGVARMIGAEAWAVADVGAKSSTNISSPIRILSGGKDLQAARAAQRQIESDWLRADTAIGKLFAAQKRRPGRVIAVIDEEGRAVHTVLRSDESGNATHGLTLISIHRGQGAEPFTERDRRLVELFHSQSAWLILRLAP